MEKERVAGGRGPLDCATTVSASTKGRTLLVSRWVYWGTGSTLCLTTRSVRPMLRQQQS